MNIIRMIAMPLAFLILLTDVSSAQDMDKNWPGFAEAGFCGNLDAVVEWGNGKYYFFRGPYYIRFDRSNNRVDDGYPKKIAETWTSLAKVGFGSKIDAALNWGNGKAYFFQGSRYVRYDIAADRVDDGYPKLISDTWRGMEKAGFGGGIDDVIKWDDDKVYFFKGNRYIRYDIAKDRVDDGYPNLISKFWKGFDQTGFDQKIDTMIRWGPRNAYFFNDRKYVRFDIKQEKVDDGYPAQICR